ncbi:MAG: DNA/RNA non-specific endonuclease [Treponema sp.]|nr:DNA/RNA non-specific endonuclease [Treponema sp.]
MENFSSHASEVGNNASEAKSNFDPDEKVKKEDTPKPDGEPKNSYDPDAKVEKDEGSESGKAEEKTYDPDEKVGQDESSKPEEGSEKSDAPDAKVGKNESDQTSDSGKKDDSSKTDSEGEKPNDAGDGEKQKSTNEGEKDNKTESYPPNSTVTIDGKECKTDDNGKVYSEDGKLKPNCEYVLGGFTYKTDSDGRIRHVEGEVQTPTEDRNTLPPMTNKDKRKTDHRGHIIGHQLGGKEDIGNLVPQDANLNQGEYKKLENELAKLKAEGHNVKMEVTLKYKGDSDRPSSFQVKYTVDGKTYVKTFKNESNKNGGN